MTALQIFREKNIKFKGTVLLCSKGGYKGDNFAYCISETEDAIHVIVISDVNPREYQMAKPEKLYIRDIETAILYGEWKARTFYANKKKEQNLVHTV